MVLAADVFADVVQQRREEQHLRPRDLGGQARRQRVLGRELAAAERAQAVDGGNRMHVDRVHVIDVVMHAADDRRKLGDHRRQEARRRAAP